MSLHNLLVILESSFDIFLSNRGIFQNYLDTLMVACLVATHSKIKVAIRRRKLSMQIFKVRSPQIKACIIQSGININTEGQKA